MAEVLIRITGEEAEGVAALESVESAMGTVQARAEATAYSIENLGVPVDRYTKQLLDLTMAHDDISKSLQQIGYSAEVAEESIARLTGKTSVATVEMGAAMEAAGDTTKRTSITMFGATRALRPLAMGLSMAGVQTRALRVGLLSANASAIVMRGGVTGLSAAFKGLHAAVGPVGWAILALAAAVAGIMYLWNQHKKRLEEQEEGLEAVATAAASAKDSLTALWVEVLRLRGAEAEAVRTEAWEEYDAEMRGIRKDYEDTLDGMEKAAGGFAAYMRRDALEAIDAVTREAAAKERLVRKLERIVEEQAEVENKAREESEDATGKSMQTKLDMAREAADEVNRIESERLKSEYDTGEKLLKDEEARVKEIADTRLELLRGELGEELALLQQQQKEVRKVRPEFRAEFVGLEEMGRRIQEAAAGIAEPEKVTEIQKRIEEVQKKLWDLQREEHVLRMKALQKYLGAEEKAPVATFA